MSAAPSGVEFRPVVRRSPAAPNEILWDPAKGVIDRDGLSQVDAIVHLAGEPIDARWTAARKARIVESRVHGTRCLAAAVAALNPRPALISASAVGYYGDRHDELLTEASDRGTGFLADVTVAWEDAAADARAAGARVVHLRTGIVLSTDGGALARMLLPFKLGLGGRVGSGRQWWSWVSIQDTVAAYLRAVTGELEGVFNLTAPNPVTNAEFTKALGRALHRPTVFPVPGFGIKAAFGEMGTEALLGGQRVLPKRLVESGFVFAHETLDAALSALFAE